MPERNTKVVERFYYELWNRWNLDTADEILAEDLRFRSYCRDRLSTLVRPQLKISSVEEQDYES